MRPLALAALLLLAALPAAASTDPTVELLRLINAYRAEHGMPALAASPRLAAAAAVHAEDMAARGYFAHVAPDGGGLRQRLRRVGYVFRFAGENLAGGQETPREVLQDWRDSPGHDANLLAREAREAGLAFLPNPGGAPVERLWVLVVAAPLR